MSVKTRQRKKAMQRTGHRKASTGEYRLFPPRCQGPEDNPTVGIILCTEKDHTVVKYSVLKDSKRLFASSSLLKNSRGRAREALGSDARRGEEAMRGHRRRTGTKQVAPYPSRPKGCCGTATFPVLTLLPGGKRIGGIAPSCIQSRVAGNATRGVSQQPAQYKLVLPSEEELRAEIERERELIVREQEARYA